jgi:phosphate transport system substrate-binding protein
MLGSGDHGISVVSKPWGLGRRIIVASLTFLAMGALLFATAGVNTEGRVAGAGSTLVNPVLQRVSTSYQGYRAADRINLQSQQGESVDWVAGDGAIDYDPVGSIGGLVRLSDPAIVFAATDVPMTAAELDERSLVQFPLINGAAAPVANLDLDGAPLVLDADTLSNIFLGQITKWNDPAIAALNPAAALPDLPIAVRRRADGSGTTWTFTGYLARSANWTAGQAAQLDWPVGEAAEGNRGVIAAVEATPGAIGYAEIGQARRAGLHLLALVNASNEVVSAGPETIRAAVADGFWSADSGISATAPAAGGGWPMTATVYVVMRSDANARENERALAFFRYFLAEAPRQADALGFVALPPAIISQVEMYWSKAFKPRS